MTSKHILKLSSINGFFENDNTIIKRGENALESNHIKFMQFDADLMIIRGDVYASMKDKTYRNEITLNKSGEIIEGSCACPRGFRCHHLAALALFGHYNISVTDKQCTWNASKPKNAEVKTSEDIYPSKPYFAIDRQINKEELNALREKLDLFGSTVGFTWLLKEETPDDKSNGAVFIIIEDIISSNEFCSSENKGEYLKEKCAIDDQQIKLIADITKGQTLNENWFLVRKHRITASNFGLILSCFKRNKFPPSLFKALAGAYNLDGIKSIQWGRTHEKTGLDYLKTNLNLDVQPTGIWLSNSGLLGASPDGLVGVDSIVEIKCPYSFRNDKLSESLKKQNTYVIRYNESGEIVINSNHKYFHQIQGLLHILKRKKCYLCIWTLHEIITVIVEIDQLWAENLSILENFYINHYLPKLMKE
ncbi:hypothetical protein RI129_003005 [Pyrocoelia pectoralis]|uniref:SWIM-type domain-containing protein n=1 Tax=Pyrocoelia pectoralis TaxID=417401 RepID=A0AAN7ZUG6_9COLE